MAFENRGMWKMTTAGAPQRATIRLPFAEKVAIGLAAAGGLMTAAVVSAIPSAQCRALAEVYFHAVQCFGAAALSGLGIIFLSYFTHAANDRIYRVVWGAFIYLFLLVGLVSFYGGILPTQRALGDAVSQCWPVKAGTPIDQNQWRWTFGRKGG